MRPDRSPIVSRPGETEAPLSFAQQRIWLLDQLEPTPWTYNITIARRLHGPLQLDPLQRALDGLLDRHEALRTTYPVIDGRPVQHIGPPVPFPLTIVDLTESDDAEAESTAWRVRRCAKDSTWRTDRSSEACSCGCPPVITSSS